MIRQEGCPNKKRAQYSIDKYWKKNVWYDMNACHQYQVYDQKEGS